ncbi:MAG: GGDEF domain-containing protein [Clostridiales bacterium]|nr:GGDEF domain-containing protein [Clostridiales bacterium]
MKKFDRLKTIQLILFVVLTIVCAIIVFTNKSLFHLIATDVHIRLISILLWAALGLSFLFIFLDFTIFSAFKQDYRELDYAVHSDPVAGIANRYSSDVLIERYLDKPLPENLGCVMFNLSNIKEINKLYGHSQGNALIRNFSNILKLASVDLCFVSRNGGNKFLAIFEDASKERLSIFLSRIHQKVRANNGDSDNHPIEFEYGISYNGKDNVDTITDLIALSNKRITEKLSSK